MEDRHSGFLVEGVYQQCCDARPNNEHSGFLSRAVLKEPRPRTFYNGSSSSFSYHNEYCCFRYIAKRDLNILYAYLATHICRFSLLHANLFLPLDHNSTCFWRSNVPSKHGDFQILSQLANASGSCRLQPAFLDPSQSLVYMHNVLMY
jgi:hypothetical protein